MFVMLWRRFNVIHCYAAVREVNFLNISALLVLSLLNSAILELFSCLSMFVFAKLLYWRKAVYNAEVAVKCSQNYLVFRITLSTSKCV